MKTTYWLLFAALIARWVFIPMDLLAGAAEWVWWTPVRVLLILALFAEAFLRLAKQDRRFWITGGLVAAAQLLGLFEDVHLILSALTVALHYAGIICFCFFLKDIAPEEAKNRADNTAWAYVLGCILVICGLLFHVGLIALIGLLLLLVCDILLLRTVFRCARCYKHEYFEWKSAYTTVLIVIAVIGIALHFFINYTSIGNFLYETRVFPTQIRWSEEKKEYHTQLYIFEKAGIYVPYSSFHNSDGTWSGHTGISAYGMESSRQILDRPMYHFSHNQARFGDCILATVNDLPWPLEENYACFDVPGERNTTVEGWRLADGWAVLLMREDRDDSPEGMYSFSEIYQYQMYHFYSQAGLTPPLLFSNYTWEDIFTEVDGETVFAGLPRDMTPEDMPKFYGMRYEDYVEDQNAYLASQRKGHQFYYNDLTFRLDGAEVRCYVAFKDDALWRITISVSAQDNGWSAEESEAYQTRMQDALNSYFGEMPGNRNHWQTEDIRIDTPFASISENLEIVVHYH